MKLFNNGGLGILPTAPGGRVMRHLDLFSGIGGFSLGLERAGMNTVAFCEQDPYCLKKLEKNWPDIPKYTDIKQLTGEQIERELGKIDVITGGFPCQPFSHAGNQKGKEDDRHLWPEMLRIISDIRPTWVIGENVTGLIKLALDDVLHDLEGQGYTTQSFIIPAAAVGAIHRRDRVWIIAHTNPQRCGQRSQQQQQGPQLNSVCKISTHTGGLGLQARIEAAGRNSRHGAYRPIGKQCMALVTDPVKTGLETPEQPSASEQAARASRSVKQSRYYRVTCESVRMPTQPAICPRNDGLPDRVARLKALGNSVMPQIPEIIGRGIMGQLC